MKTIYPDCDLNRWSVRQTCCELLANADYYYTKDEINYLLDSIEGKWVTEEEAIALINRMIADKADKSTVNELAEQVRQNTQDILNTYTKQETNSLLESYLTKLKANEMFANYTKIDGTTLVLNSEGIN